MKRSLFTIQRLMIVFGLGILALLTFLGLQTYTFISDIRIGSPSYTRIVQSKDLIADILPPPLYPAEAFSYMHILEDEPGLLNRVISRLDQIEADYRTRMAYWKENIDKLDIMEREEWASIRR